MSWVILKGQGMFYEKPIYDEMGNQVDTELIPFTMPKDESIPPWAQDPSGEIDPETGKPKLIESIASGQVPLDWPIEGAARKVAHDWMKHLIEEAKKAGMEPPTTAFEEYLYYVKYLMNKSAEQFNARVSPENRIPMYFDMKSAGQPLKSEWARTNSSHYPKDKHTEMHRPHNENGPITFYTNNQRDRFGGYHLESAAFPSWKQFGELIGHHGTGPRDAGTSPYYIPTRIGNRPHLEVMDVQHTHDGEELGQVKRYSSTDIDPLGPYHSTEFELGTREQLDTEGLLGGLDASFFNYKDMGGGTETAIQAFIDQGYTPEEAELMASTVVGAFWNKGDVRGARNAINAQIEELYGRLMEATGMSSDEIKDRQMGHALQYLPVGLQEYGLDNHHGRKLMEAAAISHLLRENNLSTPAGTMDPETKKLFHHFITQGKRPEGEMPQHVLEYRAPRDRELNTDHMTAESMELPASWSPALENPDFYNDRTLVGPGEVQTSDQSLYDLMESLQMADARMDMNLMKSLPTLDNENALIKQFSLTAQDIHFIRQSRGDWHEIAKTLMIEPRIVSLVKLSRGAML